MAVATDLKTSKIQAARAHFFSGRGRREFSPSLSDFARFRRTNGALEARDDRPQRAGAACVRLAAVGSANAIVNERQLHDDSRPQHEWVKVRDAHAAIDRIDR